jgi:hypothetical protein
MNIAAFIVSILSLVVASAAWVTSWRTQKRQLVIEETRERDRIKGSHKARLRAAVESSSDGSTARHVLRIENTGQGEARNVQIHIDGHDLRQHPHFYPNFKKEDIIGPGGHVCVPMSRRDADPALAIEIVWSDDSGEPGSYRTTLV